MPAKQPAVQVQNQAKTQNAGEDSQLWIETQEETSTGTNVGTAKKNPHAVK
jgi:hypothetical protein